MKQKIDYTGMEAFEESTYTSAVELQGVLSNESVIATLEESHNIDMGKRYNIFHSEDSTFALFNKKQ